MESKGLKGLGPETGGTPFHFSPVLKDFETTFPMVISGPGTVTVGFKQAGKFSYGKQL